MTLAQAQHRPLSLPEYALKARETNRFEATTDEFDNLKFGYLERSRPNPDRRAALTGRARVALAEKVRYEPESEVQYNSGLAAMQHRRKAGIS
jgi:hypothetical protein